MCFAWPHNPSNRIIFVARRKKIENVAIRGTHFNRTTCGVGCVKKCHLGGQMNGKCRKRNKIYLFNCFLLFGPVDSEQDEYDDGKSCNGNVFYKCGFHDES